MVVTIFIVVILTLILYSIFSSDSIDSLQNVYSKTTFNLRKQKIKKIIELKEKQVVKEFFEYISSLGFRAISYERVEDVIYFKISLLVERETDFTNKLIFFNKKSCLLDGCSVNKVLIINEINKKYKYAEKDYFHWYNGCGFLNICKITLGFWELEEKYYKDIDLETINSQTINLETINLEIIDSKTINLETYDSKAIDLKADSKTYNSKTLDLETYEFD